jgi:sigma-B regulation protein RsbU (phosphoserine phosphatase)
VLATPGQSSVFLDIPPAMPMGVVERLRPVSVDFALPVGATLVSYTDGLIERRHESLDEGFERLRLATVAKHPERLCREIMDALVGAAVPEDDIALIIMRRAAES